MLALRSTCAQAKSPSVRYHATLLAITGIGHLTRRRRARNKHPSRLGTVVPASLPAFLFPAPVNQGTRKWGPCPVAMLTGDQLCESCR